VRQVLLFGLMATFVLGSSARADELSVDRQREIIENYLYVRGQRSTPSAVASDLTGGEPLPPVKCGTPAILEFYRNYENLDRDLVEALGAQFASRPVLSYAYDTPGGHIRVHYEKVGEDAVWQANVDSDVDGTPDYVETFGLIADSVYSYMTDTLGYPAPEVDSAETGGEDARTDIYLVHLSAGLYALTWPVYDSFTEMGRRTTPVWLEVSCDFQNVATYANRPLDAARVTLAHELFHGSHFNMDPAEDITWFEMSATWMEEEQYDEINDYYGYLPFYFNSPKQSLQSTLGNHPYASVLFPIFLSEVYGRDIIKSIWMHASASLRRTYTEAADFAIDSSSGGTDDFHTAFAQFAVWNFFTGVYADQAPNGIGYSEKAAYPYIPLDAMEIHRSYPVLLYDGNYDSFPQPNAAMYTRLENLEAVADIADTLNWYVFGDSVHSGGWGVSAIFQMASVPDSHVVRTLFDSGEINDFGRAVDLDSLIGDVWVCTKDTLVNDTVRCIDSMLTLDLSQYRSITLVFSPTSTTRDTLYHYNRIPLGYSLANRSYLDSSLLNVPSAVLAPYPNPAVVSEMGGTGLTFRFRLPTDSTTYPAYPTAYLLIDLFTVAGERVKTLEGVFIGEDRTGVYREGIYEVQWDMRNDGGKDVASGAYLACARLFESSEKKNLLAEDRVKVAVIR
jgi:hypothetical protein